MEHVMKPKWYDHCDHMKHKDSMYIGTFDVITCYRDDDDKNCWNETTYDMYLYEADLGTEVCLRDGNEPPDYCSIGTLDNLFTAKSEHYRKARELLMHKGVLKYELRGDKWK